MDEEELNRGGERVFNLHRAIRLREGLRGREDDILTEANFCDGKRLEYDMFNMFNPDCILPAGDKGVVSRKEKGIDKKEFERMKDEFYTLRGWDIESGLPKRETLERLQLHELIDPLRVQDKLIE